MEGEGSWGGVSLSMVVLVCVPAQVADGRDQYGYPKCNLVWAHHITPAFPCTLLVHPMLQQSHTVPDSAAGTEMYTAQQRHAEQGVADS